MPDNSTSESPDRSPPEAHSEKDFQAQRDVLRKEIGDDRIHLAQNEYDAEDPRNTEAETRRYGEFPIPSIRESAPQASPQTPRRRTSPSAPRPSTRPSESLEALLLEELINPLKKDEIVQRLDQIVRMEWRQGDSWDNRIRIQVQRLVDILPYAGYYRGLVHNWTQRESGQYVRMIIRKLHDEATSESFLRELQRTWENMRADIPSSHPERSNTYLKNGIDMGQAENLSHILGTFRDEFVDNIVEDENDANEYFADLVLPEYESMLANIVASATAEKGNGDGANLDRVIRDYCLNQQDYTEPSNNRTRTNIQIPGDLRHDPRGRLALYYYNYLVNLYNPTVGGGEEGDAFRQRANNMRLRAVQDWTRRLSQIQFRGNGWVQGWDR